MDFRFTEADEKWRQEVQDFIKKETPSGWLPHEYPESLGDEELEVARTFEKKLAAKGWLVLAWPKEYGGGGRSHFEQLIYNEEMSYAGAPTTWNMGIRIVGPSILVYGNETQKKRYLGAIARSDESW